MWIEKFDSVWYKWLYIVFFLGRIDLYCKGN